MRFVAIALLAAACGHVASPPSRASEPPDAGPPPVDPQVEAAKLSDEAHALLKAEGDLLWKRWTTGTGPLPSSALAEHPHLADRDSIDLVTLAAAKQKDPKPLLLLRQQLATLSVARAAGAEIESLERAKAQLAFGDPPRGERDLDRMLTDEPAAAKRAAIAAAEAKAAVPLAPLVLARDAAVQKAIAELRLGSWADLEERAHGMPVADLAALAEKTLAATEQVASAAVASLSVRNLGIPADRLRRADLPRLTRSALADPEFPPGKAWPTVKDVFQQLSLSLPASLRVDAEPSPSKGARPLALLVDPPRDVRLSLRPAGGFEEQRATLHEGARSLGGALTDVPRWELAQLGDGSAAEGVAQLFEELAGNSEWLRATTQLRGEPLDDFVHTQAARRLLAARRAAAMVLFEIRRRENPQTAVRLYRDLLQRATFAIVGDDDAARWALEADTWMRSATPLLGALLAAQLETPGWWKDPQTAGRLGKIWSRGRSLTALEAAGGALDPSALARVAAAQLAYKAPDAPPPTQKPDYKYMQGDKKRRRHHKKR